LPAASTARKLQASADPIWATGIRNSSRLLSQTPSSGRGEKATFPSFKTSRRATPESASTTETSIVAPLRFASIVGAVRSMTTGVSSSVVASNPSADAFDIWSLATARRS
jgi:hypothetical protein